MPTNLHHSTLLQCRHCRARGVLTVLPSDNGGQTDLVSIKGSFHAEAGRTAQGGLMIVCNECDEIHAMPPGEARLAER